MKHANFCWIVCHQVEPNSYFNTIFVVFISLFDVFLAFTINVIVDCIETNDDLLTINFELEVIDATFADFAAISLVN